MKIIPNPQPIFPIWSKIEVKENKKIRYQITNSFELTSTIDNDVPYFNHIETSGFYNSTIIFYGANSQKKLHLTKHLIFPTFRKAINDTRGSFALQLENELNIKINQSPIVLETLNSVVLNGFVQLHSIADSLLIQRKLFSAVDYPAFITKYKIKNNSKEIKNIELHTPHFLYKAVKEECYLNNPYQIVSKVVINEKFDSSIQNEHLTFSINPLEEIDFYHVVACLYQNDTLSFDCVEQEIHRLQFLQQMNNQVQLITDNKTLDTMFSFAKIRANESIFKTKAGFLHSPGGGNYYAAIWTNDQLEYANPCFAYFSYYPAYASVIRSMDLYEPYMYHNQALVTSIIAEGLDYWNGAKDRGDGAMYAYGASRFLLTSGDEQLALTYLKPIRWCLDYTLSKKTIEGVIASDSDELENRFESGMVNLSTNAIAYAALISGADLCTSLGVKNHYKEEAESLKVAIDRYFFKEIEGFKTYQYCKEESFLRSHICYPLINGILTRKKEVINSLLHSKLLTNEGFLTSTAENVFWDRVTLMAIRGIYCGEDAKAATKLLVSYATNRLLTDHVPYAIEAYPEGNQAHLSAESALFIRIFTEGILGYVPHSFHSFYLKPALCEELPSIQINNFYCCNKKINIFASLTNKIDVFLKISGDVDLTFNLKNYQSILIQI